LGSSLGGSFLSAQITYLTSLVREPQKRETGSIESVGDLRRWIQGSQGQNGDFRNSQVSLKIHLFSLFLHKCHFLCNYVEFML